MSISLLYMSVQFQNEIPKVDKKIDFSLGGLFLAHPVCARIKRIEMFSYSRPT